MQIGEDFWPEKNVYLIDDVADIVPFDRKAIVRPYFQTIFEEEPNGWCRLESTWPTHRTFEGVALEGTQQVRVARVTSSQ